MSMRAVRVSAYGGSEVLKLENIPIPTPQQGEVLVRVHSSGVNPVDTYLMQGNRTTPRDLPFVAGLDAAGVVEEVGKGVTEFKKGDRVYVVMAMSGTCADYTVAAVRNVALLSDKLSFAQGACIGIPYYTAYKALYPLGRAIPLGTVLIHGASSEIGTAAVQMAVAKQQIVFGTAGCDKGLELVEKFESPRFKYRDTKDMDRYRLQHVGVVLELLANANLNKDLDIIAYRGRVVVVGSKERILDFDPQKMMIKEATVVGFMLNELANESELTEIKAGIQEGQDKGWLVPVVAKEYTLEDAAQAHIDILTNPVAPGRLVINVAGN